MAALVSAQSALPYNITTGARNADGYLVVRPDGVGRNSARGDDFWQTDVRLAKTVRFGRRQLEVLAEAFNVLNQRNWIAYSGDMNSMSFGKPLGPTDPRQVQLGIRLDFSSHRFGKPAVQFKTTVIGEEAAPPRGTVIRKRSPSAVTSK
jgi:hypothetical protein